MEIKNIMYRIFFLIMTPIFVLNIIIGFFMLLPYWILTQKTYYDSKHFQGFNNWWFGLIDKKILVD